MLEPSMNYDNLFELMQIVPRSILDRIRRVAQVPDNIVARHPNSFQQRYPLFHSFYIDWVRIFLCIAMQN